MNSIAKRTSDIFFQCTQHHARLSLAIKTQSIASIQSACINPHIILSENRVQEAEDRKEFLLSLPNPKHFIGHLQKNKIRKTLQIFSCIESVDSLELLYEIDRIATEEEKKIDVFLHINISEDEAKSGFFMEHLPDVFAYIKEHPLKSVRITGLFTILANHLSPEAILMFYKAMKRVFDTVKKNLGEGFREISMGMSGDYQLALMAGATIVRVGSGVFGKREM